jgi:hypothetical protein
MADACNTASYADPLEALSPARRDVVGLRLPRPRVVRRCLLGAILTLHALSLAGQISAHALGHPRLKGFVPLFYVDAESNVPTWYSSMALLLAAALLAVIGCLKLQAREHYRFHWLALAGLFLLLSMDEVAMIHEYPIDPLREALNATGALYYTWVIPGLGFVLLVGLALAGFLRSLPAATQRQMLLAAALFVGGAIGVEMLSGIQADRWGEDNLTYALIISIEELLEMLGVALFIEALLAYLAAHTDRLSVRLSA